MHLRNLKGLGDDTTPVAPIVTDPTSEVLAGSGILLLLLPILGLAWLGMFDSKKRRDA